MCAPAGKEVRISSLVPTQRGSLYRSDHPQLQGTPAKDPELKDEGTRLHFATNKPDSPPKVVETLRSDIRP